MRCAIVHYHELALKGRNRDFFEQRLVRNLRLALKDLKIRRIESLQGRIRVTIPDEVTPDLVTERLRRTCGVSNFLLTESVPLDLTAPDLTTIKQVAERQLSEQTFNSFRVTAKRADKRLPLTSMDVEREEQRLPGGGAYPNSGRGGGHAADCRRLAGAAGSGVARGVRIQT